MPGNEPKTHLHHVVDATNPVSKQWLQCKTGGQMNQLCSAHQAPALLQRTTGSAGYFGQPHQGLKDTVGITYISADSASAPETV